MFRLVDGMRYAMLNPYASKMNSSHEVPMIDEFVPIMDIILPSLLNSLNTVAVVRRPVNWKYIASARFAASATELNVTYIHFVIL